MNLKLVIMNIDKMKYYCIILFVSIFISCKNEKTFQEKICSKYIGKELVELSKEKLINKDLVDYNQRTYRLIHTLDITCCSCIEIINENTEFIEMLDEYQVAFELIGFSSYNEHSFSPVLLQYPFYFDFYREFCSQNKLIYDDITRTFLVKENRIIAVGNFNDKKFRDIVLNILEQELK